MKRNQVFSIHNLTMMAALTAIQIILARYLSIQSEMFRFSFETIPLALAGLWLGPVPAMLVALVSDIIGFSLAGIGVYFLSEGKYEVEGYGRCTVSVNQAEPPYIAVTDSAGAGYVFSLNDPEDTRALYEELMGASAGGM